jgi:ABC-type sugar transport system permease subunit
MKISKSRGRKWLQTLIVAIVVVIAILLRLRAVDLLPIDFDEDDYLLAGQHYAQSILQKDFQGIINNDYNLEHPPLNKIVYGVVLAALPQIPAVAELPTSAPPASSLPEPHFKILRYSSALFGVLEVLLVALLDPLAGLLLAVHTFTIKYTSQVMLEALPAFTSTVTVLAYVKAISSASDRGRYGWWLLSATALGLTAAAKYIYAVVGFAIVIHWLFIAWRQQVTGLQSSDIADSQPSSSSWGGWSQQWSLIVQRIWPILIWGLVAVFIFFLADPFLWADPLNRLKASILYNTGYSQSTEVHSAGYPFWQPLVTVFMSVPWHPGVFVIAIDTIIALLALAGIKPAWRKNSIIVVWLVVAFVFLLVWPTKWPQYILVLTVPLSFTAAEGFRAVIWNPAAGWMHRRKGRQLERKSLPVRVRTGWRETRAALPWLLPGIIVLSLIALFPLIFQAAMSLTDFRAMAIKDGLSGGVWREVWLGLTGQVEPVEFDPFSQTFSRDKEVNYAGFSLFGQLFSGFGTAILVFEVMWVVLSVGLQLALGLVVAMMLYRKDVKFKRFWAAIFILPWAIPEFVGALIWARMFEPRFGWLALATSFPDTPGYSLVAEVFNWQERPDYALVVLLVAATWYGFPLMVVAASAALRMITSDVHDAAALDGAGGWNKFRFVVWPMIFPLLAPAIIIRTVFAFNQFYLFYVLNPPFPMITLATLSFYMVDTNSPFGGQFAVSAVINVFTVVALVVFLLWFTRWSRAGEGVTYA